MRFAYKIPTSERAKIVYAEHESGDGLSEVFEALQHIAQEWQKQGGPGPDSPDVDHKIFAVLPKFMNAVKDPNTNGFDDPEISHVMLMLDNGSHENSPLHHAHTKIAFLPAIAAGLGLAEGAGLGTIAGAAMKKLAPQLGLGMMLGGGGGGQQQMAPPINPTDVYASYEPELRGNLEIDSFQYRTAKDPDIEGLRTQVVNALKAWGASQTIPTDENSKWWQMMDHAKSAEGIASLSLIMGGIPEEYQNAGQSSAPQNAPVVDDQGNMVDNGGNGNPTTPAPEAIPAADLGPQSGGGDDTGGAASGGIPGTFSSVKESSIEDILEELPGQWKIAELVADPAQAVALMQDGTQQNMTPLPQQWKQQFEQSAQGPQQQQDPQANAAMNAIDLESQGVPKDKADLAATMGMGVNTPQVAPNTANPTAPEQNLPSMRTAEWLDVNGEPLQPGEHYMMTSDGFDVPDTVHVMSHVGDNLKVQIDNGRDGVTLEMGPQHKQTSRFRFERLAMVSANEQRVLIDEDGVARNLDRLNLSNSHYEAEYPDFIASISGEQQNLPLSNVALLAEDNPDSFLFM